MRIAIFDYQITRTNPIGNCHRRMLEGLCNEHEFVVFAVRFENPCPQRIKFVRIPVPIRPLALLFVLYHIVAPLRYFIYRMLHHTRFDIVQTVESNCLLKSIIYTQFCHKRFLREHWPKVKIGGLRGILRWLDHFLHSLTEPIVYGRAKGIVIASNGLGRELEAEYPAASGKIKLILNPVDLDGFVPPPTFDRDAQRQQLGINGDEVMLTFIALGHFERKGLPLLLDALRGEVPPSVKLVVVGGEGDLVRLYQERAEQLGLASRVTFVGMQKDVRPFLWAADLFVLPSIYEVSPLVALQAAAAARPIVAPRINGIEDYLRDGLNGFMIERSAKGIEEAIKRFLALTPEQRLELGRQVRQDMRSYSIPQFVQGWRDLYSNRASAV